MKRELGNLIRLHRAKRDLKKAELARKLKISVAYVNHLETECQAAVISESLIDRVIEVLNLPVKKTKQLSKAHNSRVKRYRDNLRTA